MTAAECCVSGVCDAHNAYNSLLGREVVFAENDEHPRVLGVVKRLWPNRRYLTIVSDGRSFVREASRVTVCDA